MASPFSPPPFAPPPLPPPPGGFGPVALVASTQEQVDAYLALGAAPQEYVVVRTADDVPERLGGMAILTDADLGDELRTRLVTALGADPS